MVSGKQAKEWLREGKKIRLPHWQPESYLSLRKEDGCILYREESNAVISIDQLDSSGWELYSRNLSNERFNVGFPNQNIVIKEDNVKKAINEIREWILERKNKQLADPSLSDYWGINIKFRELFGEDLICLE